MQKEGKRQILYLNRAQIDSLGLSYKDLTSCISKSFTFRGQGETEMPPKWGVFPKDSSFIHAMPASIKGDVNAAGLKWVSMYAANPTQGLPAIHGLIVLNDIDNGIPLAVMDCGLITEKRTAAAGIVGVQELTFKDAKTLAIIGMGRVGTQHFLAALELFPHITHYYLYDSYAPSLETAKKHVSTLPSPAPEVTFCSTVEAAVKEADIIISCVSMTKEIKPFIDPKWLKEKHLIVAQDYDAAFPHDCFANADEFIVDDKGQYQTTKKSGLHFEKFPMEPTADMGEVSAKKYTLKADAKKRAAVFQGIATHDIVTAKLVYEKAKEAGKGIWLDM